MKVATWNMNRRSEPGRAAAWAWLGELGVQLALVPEAPFPIDGRAVFTGGGVRGAGWGSAVVALDSTPVQSIDKATGYWRGRAITPAPAPLLITAPGCVAIGR